MDYTDITVQMALVAFLAVFTLIRQRSKIAMMLYVIAFNLFFAYKLNGALMWLLPATACFNYALTQEMKTREGAARKHCSRCSSSLTSECSATSSTLRSS